MVNGASGSIGAAALQPAKFAGAEVTGVCGTPRMAYVRSLGADTVIDYTETDFSQGSEQYNLILDILGRSSFLACRGVLAPEGRYLRASFKLQELLQMAYTAPFGKQKVICALAPEKSGRLPEVKELVEAGHLKAIVDRVFPMEEAAEAHRYAESGRKKSNVVISF